METIERLSSIHFLPAMHGDAFFIHCFQGEEEGWVIVDGGPNGNAKFNPFIKEVEKLSSKDLMVMTHIDDDHLKGIFTFVRNHQEERPFPVRKMWVNCARQIVFIEGCELSASSGSKLADILDKISSEDGIQWKDYITAGYQDDGIKFAEITLLNPEKDMLNRFIPIYEEEAKKHKTDGKKLSAQTDKRPQEDYKISLTDLAKRPKSAPKEINFSEFKNMVSIAFIIRCDGFAGLMLGDSFPEQIVIALTKLGYSKVNKLKVDFVKVAHHGSRNNISNDLLDMIDCINYLIPTNGGANACHPDRETMANIICHEGRSKETLHLYFNYTIKSIEARKGFRLFHKEEPKDYNFEIHEPNYADTGQAYRITLNRRSEVCLGED